MTERPDYDQLLDRGAVLYLQVCDDFMDIRWTKPFPADHYDDVLVLLGLLERHLAQRVRELVKSGAAEITLDDALSFLSFADG